jgi:transposase-like protein
VGDRCAGPVTAIGGLLPETRYRRRMAHFEGNVLSKVSRCRSRRAADALQAILASENREAASAKAGSVARRMKDGKLNQAAACLREGIRQTAAYPLDDYPREHRRRIRTNNTIERSNREIRRRTRVVGAFPDGKTALMPIGAGIRHVTANQWPTRRHPDMPRLDDTTNTAN